MDLKLNIQYVSDRKGIKTAVLIPVKEWENLKDEYIKLKQYKALKQELKEAFLDIKEIERGNSEEITLSEFLNEC